MVACRRSARERCTELAADVGVLVVLAGTTLGAALALVAPDGAAGIAVLALAAPVALLLIAGTGWAGEPAGERTHAVVAALVALALAVAAGTTGGPAVVPTLLVVQLVMVGAALAGRSSRRPAYFPLVRTWCRYAGIAAAFVAVGAAPTVAGAAATLAGALTLAPTPAREPGYGPLPLPHRPRRTRPDARWAVAGLAAVGFGLRLADARGLWLDELTSVGQARLGFVEMLAALWREDSHPPLHHVLLWLDVRLIGDGELAVRLPSIVMGTLLVPLVYAVGRELYDRRTALIAAGLCSVAPLAVWYSQEARMYSQFMLLAMVGVWVQARLLDGAGARWWVVFTAANTALACTQWFSLLHVAALHLVFLTVALRRRRAPDEATRAEGERLLRDWGLAAGAQFVVLLPLLPLALSQFMGNQAGGVGLDGVRAAGSALVPEPSMYSLVTNVGWALFGYQPDELMRGIVALWPVALLGVLLLLGRARRPGNRYLLVVAGLPTLGVFAISLLGSGQRSLAEVRYFAGAVPTLLLLAASGITGVLVSRRAQALAAVTVAAVMLAALASQATSQDNPRVYGYREALTRVAAEAEPGDRLVYAPYFLDDALAYYPPGIPWSPLEEGLPRTRTGGRVFLLTSASFAESAEGEGLARRAAEQLQEDGRRMVREIREPQVTVTVYR